MTTPRKRSLTNDKRPLTLPDGRTVDAQYPVIVSASRSTDIPAFYADWFFRRLEAGYSVWINPFNGVPMCIAYADTRFIVFWSKNPAPLLPYLDRLREKNIKCYIQYTLNDYVSEGYEPHVPSVEARIATFRELSQKLGKDAVIWRCDPLMLTDKVQINDLLRKIAYIGDALHKYTSKLVFSFVDIGCYAKVRNNLKRKKIDYKEWSETNMRAFAAELRDLNTKQGWGFELATCAESLDFDGIAHNHCIDDQLMVKIASDDAELMQHLGYEIRQEQMKQQSMLPQSEPSMPKDAIELGGGRYAVKVSTKKSKDSGQRTACGCIKSKDIGQYNTCKHFCVYCYANWNEKSVTNNYNAHTKNPNAETITGTTAS